MMLNNHKIHMYHTFLYLGSNFKEHIRTDTIISTHQIYSEALEKYQLTSVAVKGIKMVLYTEKFLFMQEILTSKLSEISDQSFKMASQGSHFTCQTSHMKSRQLNSHIKLNCPGEHTFLRVYTTM